MVVDCDGEEDKVWVVYDAGPKTVRCPLIFLPPASGTADVFFKQLLALSSLGYRVMSVSIVYQLGLPSIGILNHVSPLLSYETICAICYHLYNLKNVKKVY